MKACCCSLPPEACKTCPSYSLDLYDSSKVYENFFPKEKEPSLEFNEHFKSWWESSKEMTNDKKRIKELESSLELVKQQSNKYAKMLAELGYDDVMFYSSKDFLK